MVSAEGGAPQFSNRPAVRRSSRGHRHRRHVSAVANASGRLQATPPSSATQDMQVAERSICLVVLPVSRQVAPGLREPRRASPRRSSQPMSTSTLTQGVSGAAFPSQPPEGVMNETQTWLGCYTQMCAAQLGQFSATAVTHAQQLIKDVDLEKKALLSVEERVDNSCKRARRLDETCRDTTHRLHRTLDNVKDATMVRTIDH